MIQLGCNGCVHEDGWDSNYMGNCKDCCRNPAYYDAYWEKEKEEKPNTSEIES